MVVCQYFLRGQCKFGTQCRNDHTTQRPGAFGTSPWSLQNTSKPPLQLGFTVETVRKDLTEGIDRPLWPLTCFGASKHEPNLVAGMDESPEELRWRAVTALKSGNASEYEKYEQEKMGASRQLYANLLGNVTDTFRQAGDLSVANQRGVVQTAPFGPGGTNGPSTTSTIATSTPATTTTTAPTSTFGKPSTFASSGTTPVSAFGANSSTPTFGKPAFGQSAFGQPAFGQSPFGASTKPVSAFGAPSVFGQPSTTQSAFGQPSTSTQSAFGQSSTPTQSAFGQATTPTSVFGQSSFGQPSQPQSSLIKPATAFGSTPATSSSGGGAFAAFAGGGTSAFASTSNAANTNSVFGRSAFSGGGNAPQSAFGVPTAQPISAFSGTAQPTSAFGQSNNAPTSAFGQSNNQAQAPTFGQPSQPVSAFGSVVVNQQPQSFESAFGRPQNTQPVSAFGQPPIQPTSVFGQSQNTGATSQSVFGQGPSSSAFGSSLPPKPAAAAAVGPPNFEAALASFSAKPGADKYDQMLPPNYADLIPAFAKEAFAAPKFEWGKIPDWVPPVQFR